MKELKKQLLVIWSELKPLQRLAIASLACFLGVAFSYLLLHSSSSSYVSLYPKGRLSAGDIEEVRAYMDAKQIEYQERAEGQLFVPEERVSKVRATLSQLGIPKHSSGKGFELFDSNTWIKGDKEIQVLQVRALKGQLQQDLAEFENIKSASVILDLPGQHLFGDEKEEAKASVILNLMPNAHLSHSELRAITYHLAGAVRGLKPNMIAISDTKGRLYQAIDPEVKNPIVIGAELLFEEQLKEKVSSLVHALLGKKPFFVSICAKLKEEAKLNGIYEAIDDVQLFLLLDSRSFENDAIFEGLKPELVKQIALLMQMACPSFSIKIERSLFHVHDEWIRAKRPSSPLLFLLLAASGFTLIFLVAAFIHNTLKRRKKKRGFLHREIDLSAENGSIDSILARLNSKALYSLLCEEEPESLALFFAEIEKENAEKLISILPLDLQQKILKALASLKS